MTAFDSILRRLGNQEVILPLFENAMRSRPDDYYGTGDGYFHPSTHPLMDERLLYYLFHPETSKFIVEEPFSLPRDIAAEVGTSLHELIQKTMVQAGLVKPENVEREFLSEDHHIRGRIDMIVDHPTRGPIIVDIKSRVHYKFSKQEVALPKWEAQMSIILDHMGQESGVILMVETGWPFRTKEFPVTRNDALLSKIYSKFDRVLEAVALNRPPEPCCAPNSPTVSSCQARHACWLNPGGPLHVA